MTYREALTKEKRWSRRAHLINIFHSKMLLKRRKWNMRLTAKYLSISLGQVSEGIRLAKALNDNANIEGMNRDEALKSIR
jgi:hypothetical protein